MSRRELDGIRHQAHGRPRWIDEFLLCDVLLQNVVLKRAGNLRPIRAFDRVQQRHRGLAIPMAVIKKFGDDGAGRVAGLQIAQAAPAPPFGPIAGTEKELPAQLVLLAMGFLGPASSTADRDTFQRECRACKGTARAIPSRVRNGNQEDRQPYTAISPECR